MDGSFDSLFLLKKMILIVSLPDNDPNLAREAFLHGADAVKVHVGIDHRASGTLYGPYPDYAPIFEEMLSAATGPMGIVPGGSLQQVEENLDAVARSGFSFISVYAQNAPSSVLKAPQSLMLSCGVSTPPEESAHYKTCGASVMEASIIKGERYGERLSLQDLAQYRHLAKLSSLPMIVPTQLAISPDEIPLLFEAGVRGLMIGAIVTGKDLPAFSSAVLRYRKAIDAL